MRLLRVFFSLVFLTAVLGPPAPITARVSTTAFANFEGAQTSPLCLSPDGTRLLVVNTADARLSVFDLASPSLPRLIAEIPVGLEPVTVKARTNDEAWVVNQLSDSISVVSLSGRLVTDTIQVNDEPMDVVFAGGKAFVSVSRRNEIRVFDPATHRQLGASIPVLGNVPRALAVSPDGAKVYAAFAFSGNRTTIVPGSAAPTPPAPGPGLPPAPQQGLIVRFDDPVWNPSFIRYNLPDNDVVEIDVASQSVSRYFSGVGTINFGLAVRPTTGDLYVANTDARNLVRFEPALRGHPVDNRVTRILRTSGQVTPYDLNPDTDYQLLPNPVARATALAQPTALVFEPNGKYFYAAAYGSDRVARVGLDGAVISRIEIGEAQSSREKRGPRGLTLRADVSRLYVANRISNTISVVATNTDRQIYETPIGSFDPTPSEIKAGRGFLYDAKLSGNGTASCASCHVDAEQDLLAWDLGDPNGEMVTLSNLPPFLEPAPASPGPFALHPLKGPMLTQSLRGLDNAGPLHWRGDRANFESFNVAYDRLLGGSKISANDMGTFAAAVRSILYAPNPNQKLDRSTPLHFGSGEPYEGLLSFSRPQLNNMTRTCSGCHSLSSRIGSDLTFREVSELGTAQVFKVPQLRGLYLRSGFDNRPGAASISGFGFGHDGSEPTVFSLLSHTEFFGDRANDAIDKNNLEAYMLCFDTGVAPAVGQTRTLTAQTVHDAELNEDLSTMINQTGRGSMDLIAKGVIDGRLTGLLYRAKTQDFQVDKIGVGPFTQEELAAKIAAGGTLSFMGVVPGTGRRLGLDRNLDGVLDGDDSGSSCVRADFDGDGRTDISVFRPENGGWYILNSDDGSTSAAIWGLASDRLAPADYDGDGRTDIAVFRDGNWHVLRSKLGYLTMQFGIVGDIPTPGDYDGDGVADLAVWRPSNGTWYIVHSLDGFRAVQFGAAGDRPVPGDYDGDGKQDPAVYRDGTWYLLRSQSGFGATVFGTANDRPVNGDYDGDGKADLAVWRPSDRTWYALRTTDNGLEATTFGAGTDLVTPGDYDGDSRSDLAVFRPSNGTWYLLVSSSNQLRVQYWGGYQDLPVPAALVP